MTADYRSFAIDIAHRAGDVMSTNFQLGVTKTWKSDNTPLTVTDLMINEMVITGVAEAYPDHGVIAEEGNSKGVKNCDWVWICDPIDGTVPFSHGVPTFAFSLALVHKGKSVLGVVFDPLGDRMFVAERGEGAVMNGKPTSVSPVDRLDNVVIDLEDHNPHPTHAPDIRQRLRERGVLIQSLYSAVYGGSLVACGQHAATICNFVHVWDAAALSVIIEEAGGRVSDLQGNDLRLVEPLDGFIVSNGDVHDALVEVLAGR